MTIMAVEEELVQAIGNTTIYNDMHQTWIPNNDSKDGENDSNKLEC